MRDKNRLHIFIFFALNVFFISGINSHCQRGCAKVSGSSSKNQNFPRLERFPLLREWRFVAIHLHLNLKIQWFSKFLVVKVNFNSR